MADKLYELMYGKEHRRMRSHKELAHEHRRLAKYHESAYLKHLHRSREAFHRGKHRCSCGAQYNRYVRKGQKASEGIIISHKTLFGGENDR